MNRRFFLGLDLGQRRDATALVVVERWEKRLTGMDWIAHSQRVQQTSCFAVRYATRAGLGTTYTRVVRGVAEMVDQLSREGQCTVVVDATGVGAPVVDLLREAGMNCEVVAVTITGGDGARRVAGGYTVPKKDLMGGLQVGIEDGRLWVAEGLKEWPRLMEELMAVRVMVGAGGVVRYEATGRDHDDMAVALALAYWRARFGEIGEKGERLL